MRSISFRKSDLVIATQGLAGSGLPELRVEVNAPSLLSEGERFLRFVADYLLEQGAQIKPGETLNYGYWLVKFQPVGKGLLEVWEYNPEATEFVLGASLTLRYWQEQHRICELYGAEFAPPRPDKLTAVSAGVMEGLPVRAVRYPWQEHMSGWLLVTDQWDKNIKSLTNHHTYHVTAARPDLAPFLALPVGFRFDLTRGQQAWVDPEVLHQPQI
jgi:hypothetical protein